jgi:hypothetical protein
MFRKREKKTPATRLQKLHRQSQQPLPCSNGDQFCQGVLPKAPRAAKAHMNAAFEANQVGKDDHRYQHDSRAEPEPAEDSGWDIIEEEGSGGQ